MEVKTTGSDNVHTDDMTQLQFFDDTPGLTPEEKQNIEATRAASEKAKEQKKIRKERKKTRTRRMSKSQGVFALPVYLATYNLMNECDFRFRSLPNYAKSQGRVIEDILLDICTDIQLVHWQIIPHDRLPDIFKKMLKVLVMIRSLRDTRKITKHDFGCLCRFAGPMSKHMRQWSNAYNPGTEIKDQAAWSVMTVEGEPPGMYLAEEDRNSDGTPVEQEKTYK